MSDGRIGRFAGRGSMRTLVQLVFASVVVGAFLAFWGVSPGEFWRGVFNFIRGIVRWLGDSVGEIVANLLTYLLFGAAIVVPIWLIMRVIGGRDAARRD